MATVQDKRSDIDKRVKDALKEASNVDSLKELSRKADGVQIKECNWGKHSWKVSMADDSNSAVAKCPPKADEAFTEMEFKALSKFYAISEQSVPRPCHSSAAHKVFFQNDVPGYTSLQQQLEEGVVDLVAIQKLGERLGAVHRATHVTTLKDPDFAQLKKDFDNDAAVQSAADQWVDIQDVDHSDNVQGDQIKSRGAQVLNSETFDRWRHLLTLMVDKKESLVHGRLRFGSVLAKEGDCKMCDLELAHVGPCSVDLGFVLADVILYYHKHLLTPEDNDWHRRVAYKLLDAAHKFAHAYLSKMQCSIGDRNQYVQTMMSEVAGYCGGELFRMVYSGELKHLGTKQIEILESAIRLMGAYHRIHDVDRLLNIALMLTY